MKPKKEIEMEWMVNGEATEPHGMGHLILCLCLSRSSLALPWVGTHLSRKASLPFYPFKFPVGPISKILENAGSWSIPAEGALGAELRTGVGNRGGSSQPPSPEGWLDWCSPSLPAELKDRSLVLLALSYRILLINPVKLCWRPCFPALHFFPLQKKKDWLIFKR